MIRVTGSSSESGNTDEDSDFLEATCFSTACFWALKRTSRGVSSSLLLPEVSLVLPAITGSFSESWLLARVGVLGSKPANSASALAASLAERLSSDLVTCRRRLKENDFRSVKQGRAANDEILNGTATHHARCSFSSEC